MPFSTIDPTQKKPVVRHDFKREGFEPLLDSEQAAKLLQIHPKTLQRMARKGEVPAIQIGKLWRFRGSQLYEWTKDIIAHSYPCRLNSEKERI